MVGDLTTGYIVTPHSQRTYIALEEVFRGRINQAGEACLPSRRANGPEPSASQRRPSSRRPRDRDPLSLEPV